MAKPPIPPHIPTADEIDAYVIEKVAADGTMTVQDADGSLVTARRGVLDVGGTLTLRRDADARRRRPRLGLARVRVCPVFVRLPVQHRRLTTVVRALVAGRMRPHAPG